MKKYTDYSHIVGEFEVEATLKIEDDGKFSYDEWWHCYGASTGGEASGNWWKYGDKLYFHCDFKDGSLCLDWSAGETRTATEHKDELDFGPGFTMSLSSPEPVQPVPLPKDEETAPKEEVPKKMPFATVGKLHFKDGSVRTQQLPPNFMPELCDQTYYRLIDDKGRETNIFKARSNSGNQDPRIIEYDEIEMPPAVKSDDIDD